MELLLLFSLWLSHLWKLGVLFLFRHVVAVFFLKLISRSLPQGFAQEKGLIFAEERPEVSLSIPRGVNLFGTRVLYSCTMPLATISPS